MPNIATAAGLGRFGLALPLLLAAGPAAAQPPADPGGQVLYRARTDVDGRRLGVELRIVDAGGVAGWALHRTTVEPTLANQVYWERSDCSLTEVETYLRGVGADASGDYVLGYVPCDAQDRALYWSLAGVNGETPTDWTSAAAFEPDGPAASTDADGDGDGRVDQRDVLQGGVAIWVRSAAVLAGFATLAVIVVGVVLFQRLRTVERAVRPEHESGEAES